MTDRLHFWRHRSGGGEGSEQTSWEIWNQQNPDEWDAPAKEARGAQNTAREAMLESEPYEADAGAGTMPIDLHNAFAKSTPHRSMELEEGIANCQSYFYVCCVGISRTREGRRSRALQQRQCKNTQQYCQRPA